MTDDTRTEIQTLRRKAHLNRGAALMALTAGAVLEAADLHVEIVRDEARADELEKSLPVLAAH